MKDQPLPFNSAVDLWSWVNFSVEFSTSFGSLSETGVFHLVSFL